MEDALGWVYRAKGLPEFLLSLAKLA